MRSTGTGMQDKFNTDAGRCRLAADVAPCLYNTCWCCARQTTGIHNIIPAFQQCFCIHTNEQVGARHAAVTLYLLTAPNSSAM